MRGHYIVRVEHLRTFVPSLWVPVATFARKTLIKAGCEIEHEEPGSKGFYSRDPFGFIVDVVERT